MNHVCPDCGQLYGQPGVCPRDRVTLAPQDDPLLGQALGSYRITKLLGVGGMGRVYAAVQPSIGARVAVKVLSQECAQNQELIDRFFAEARAVNLIRHEQIVNVLDLAQFPDGRPYIMMEHLDGVPLSQLIAKRGRLPLGTLAMLIAEVLDALGAAHGRHIIHRDLKPDNVFVSPGGHAKVLDFGIAKLDPGLAGGQVATRAGSIMGTPLYMAPEQALAQKIDARADLYSVGIILYEAATGEVPFNAPSLFEILRMHVEKPPRPPRQLVPPMPAVYEAVILRALEKDPARRFQSAHDMATALAAAAQGLPPAAWDTLRGEGGSAAGPKITPFSAQQGFLPTLPARRSAKGKIMIAGAAVAAIATVIVMVAVSSKTGEVAGHTTPTLDAGVARATATRMDAGGKVATAIAAVDAGVAVPPADAAPMRPSIDAAPAAQALSPPPWGADPIPRHLVPPVFVAQWRKAQNKATCPILFPTDLGAGAGANPRAASFLGGWAVAYDKKGGHGVGPDGYDCDSCGRSAFGVAGTGSEKGGSGHWPKVIHWSDGSSVSYGLEGDTGPGYLAYLELADAGCLYNVWSNLGEEHLVQLINGLRRVGP